MIGSGLQRLCAGPMLESYRHEELDITDYVALERAFLRHKPELVLNAAAFTKVDDCEKFRETAFLVNAQAPGHIGALCARFSSTLIHYSTDFVFDGEGSRPYPEDHPPRPLNNYGVTKWEGEKQIAATGCKFLIIRTSWIFGRNGDNFVKKVLRRALGGATLQAPVDQIGVPTSADDIVDASRRLFEAGATGVYHFSNSGSCSRFEQARTILQLYGLNNSVEPAKNDSLPTPARRPHYSVLDCTRYTERTGRTPRTWQQSTAEYIAFLKENDKELRS